MAKSKQPSPTVTKRPPTNAKLAQWIEELESESETQRWLDASDAVQALYAKGLPPGLDPALVTAAIHWSVPHGCLISRMVRRAERSYDQAIIEGARRHRAQLGCDHALELLLVALLAEHSTRSIAEAHALLTAVGEVLDRNPDTNAPTVVTSAMVREVARVMAPWMTGAALEPTLELAADAMPPAERSFADRRWVTLPQGDEEWALLIVCAADRSERAQQMVAQRRACVELLDEPFRTTTAAVLDACAALAR